MRLAAAAAAVALSFLPAASRAQNGPGAATPPPASSTDAGAATPPKAGAAPRAGPTARSGTPTKPPAAANDLARALLTSEQWGKVLDSYASSLASQITQALVAKGEKAPDDLRGKLRGELEKTLPYQQTVQAQAEALAQQLNPDELRRTATFYGSPLGRKVLDKLPEAQSQVAQELQGKLATAVPEIVNRLAPSAMPSGGPGGAGARGSGTGTGSGAPAGGGPEGLPEHGAAGGGAPAPGHEPPAQGGATR